jgi:type IV pilus assembly protein PilW
MTRKLQTGFSMVELMVALTLSLILIAGVLSLVYSSKVTYMENERVAGTQEGGRAAFEMIMRDLRGSGFPGCAPPSANLVVSNNVLTNNTSILWALDVPMQGYEGTSGTWTPGLDPILSGAAPAPAAKNDILVIRTIRAGLTQVRIANKMAATDKVTVTKTSAQKVVGSNTFVISDCQSETFFAASVADNVTTATLTPITGGTAPKNQSASLVTGFDKGALVTPLDTVVYYIAPSSTPAVQGAAAGPALWRIVSSVNNAQPEELVPGVERMELKYGVDTDGDTIVDEYDDANAVNAAGNWNNVVSVRMAILVRSLQANSPDLDKKTYTLLDSSAGPFNDHYERSLYTTTVALRNRTT